LGEQEGVACECLGSREVLAALLEVQVKVAGVVATEQRMGAGKMKGLVQLGRALQHQLRHGARGSVRIGTAQGNAEKRMTEPEQGARIFVGRECPVQRAFELGWRGRWVELGAAVSQP